MRKLSGDIVFSPISHTHPIAEECELPKGWDFWRDFDLAYLRASERLVILRIEGWKESIGVSAEFAIAQELGLVVEFMDADGRTEMHGALAAVGEDDIPY